MNKKQWMIFMAVAWLALAGGITWQWGSWGLIAFAVSSLVLGFLMNPKEDES